MNKSQMASKLSRTNNLEIPRAESSSAVGRRGLLKKGVAVAAGSGAAAFLGGGAADAAQRTARANTSSAKDTESAAALDVLLAKQAITDVIYRYSRGLDRMDKELALSIWNPGATADYGPAYVGTGPGFIDWVWNSHRRLVAHSHQMTNILIKVNGNTAVSETYGMASLHAQPSSDKASTTLVRLRYVDRWSQHNGVWGIDHRKCIVDFSTVHEAAPVPAALEGGRRDTQDPSYAIFGH